MYKRQRCSCSYRLTIADGVTFIVAYAVCVVVAVTRALSSQAQSSRRVDVIVIEIVDVVARAVDLVVVVVAVDAFIVVVAFTASAIAVVSLCSSLAVN